MQIGDFLQERQGLRPRPDEQVGGIQDDPRHAHDDVQPEQPQRAERPVTRSSHQSPTGCMSGFASRANPVNSNAIQQKALNQCIQTALRE